MKIEVGQTYKLSTGGPCKIVHKLDLPGENHPYLGVSLACGSCAYFNETGASGSIRLVDNIEEPTLQPFTRDTFPVDAWLRRKNATEFHRVVFISESDVGIIFPGAPRCCSWQHLLEDWEYSVDGCKTWHPCGVRE